MANQDLIGILRETKRQFGRLQRKRYSDLIQRAIEMVAKNPERPGSRRWDDLAAGVRSFHIKLAARRRGSASHVVY